ncbi:MAG TPA: methyltransferase [Azospirillaceae bacterium]|nr:methyltransferase [Azospirillaceae bacterium]
MANTSQLDPAAEVMADLAFDLGVAGHVLVAGDRTGAAARGFAQTGAAVARWDRRAGAGTSPSAWPPAGPFDAAALRMPSSKPELDMALHALASVVRPGGRLFLFGANDEGIKSAGGRMEPLLGPTETLAVKRHCRVLAADRPETVPGLRASLEQWRTTVEHDVGGGPRPFATYPGLFARGEMDPGTRLLLTTLPRLKEQNRALDFGCGIGVVGAAILALWPETQVDLLDADTVALVAARANVPGAGLALGTGLGDVAGTYHLIASNPPIHLGKAEDYGVLRHLLTEGPRRLTRSGQMLLVVQKRVPVDRMAEAAGVKDATVDVAAEDKLYRVWRLTRG